MTGIIVKFIKIIVGIVSFLYPDNLFMADVFTNFNSYLNTFIDFLAAVNFLIPLPDIMKAFSLMVSLTVIKFTLFIANWVIKRVFDVIP